MVRSLCIHVKNSSKQRNVIKISNWLISSRAHDDLRKKKEKKNN